MPLDSLLGFVMQYAMRPDIQHVTEIGVQNVGASYGLAKAAAERGSGLVYRAHDREMLPANAAMDRLMGECPAIDYKFTAGDDLKITIEETDALFLDTWHTDSDLAAELNQLSEKTRKLMVLPYASGIHPAIIEFLASHDDWGLLPAIGQISVLQRSPPLPLTCLLKTKCPCHFEAAINTRFEGLKTTDGFAYSVLGTLLAQTGCCIEDLLNQVGELTSWNIFNRCTMCVKSYSLFIITVTAHFSLVVLLAVRYEAGYKACYRDRSAKCGCFVCLCQGSYGSEWYACISCT